MEKLSVCEVKREKLHINPDIFSVFRESTYGFKI